MANLTTVAREGLNLLWPHGDGGESLRHREFGDILALQLKLQFALAVPADRCEENDPTRRTLTGSIPLATLLHDHPSPPAELLQRIKAWAKASVNEPASPLPTPVARVIYFACIAAARLRSGAKITSLGEMELSEGLHWAEREPWVDAETVKLLRDALRAGSPTPAERQ